MCQIKEWGFLYWNRIWGKVANNCHTWSQDGIIGDLVWTDFQHYTKIKYASLR